ncbi:3-dehydroshikimate dehydratase [Teratosphaeria nubilosa]|uniref:3-dehydroshikimate dehydratase n=1 Tax=Teratosphaeria nubilosa TaxID=161662 RepID=A0A6G1LE94_9PEZI|nr:3-dehydroshikimate dehydratase [Teratosphaeria nubilosa]
MHIRPAICSHSLGRAWVHSLPEKFDQAARYKLDIELFFEDLLYVARELPGGDTPENQLEAARIIRKLADERGIIIMCLQPFMHYEGLRDRQKHNARIEEMKLWLEMAAILGTNMISIPSTCQPEDEMSGDIHLIVSDLRKVADLGAGKGIQFAYESLCWGTYSDTWEQSWEIVQRVDRPNFGICLDTFNMAGRRYADPASETRKTANAEAEIRASLRRLVETVDVRKIAYIQVVDAEYLQDSLDEAHPFYDPAQPARMSWSRNCRTFYGEHDRGAYLPIQAILKAILVDLQFEGWVSAELFNRSLADPGPSVPEEHARRAAVSWQRILHDFGPTDDSVKKIVLGAPTEQVARAQL